MNSSISSSRPLALFAACFAATLLICGAASEWLVRNHVEPIDTLTRHVSDFRDVSARHVAFGDSRIARGFDARAPFRNLAYPSENIDQMAWKVDAYLTRVPAPKHIILQADPHLFSAYRLEAGIGDYAAQLGPASGQPRLHMMSAHHRPKIRAYWQRFIMGGGKLTSKIEQTPRGTLLSPGDFSLLSEPQRTRIALARVKLQTPVTGFADTPEAEKYAATLNALAESGADICLLQTPLSPAYRAALNAAPEADKAAWQAAEDWFDAQAGEIANIRHVDLSTLSDELALFRDSDHFNKIGAQTYSTVITEACFGEQLDEGPRDRVSG